MRSMLSAALSCSLGLAAVSWAGTPTTLSVEGRLSLEAAVPVEVGVSLYDDADTGAVLHSEVVTVTPDAQGRFTAVLGAGAATIDPAYFAQPVFAEVVVDPNGTPAVLGPRLPLRAAPYALRASRATDLAPAQEVHVEAASSPGPNGAALVAAVAGITDAGNTKRYVVRVGPGSYDLNATGTLVLPSYVDLVGAGRDATFLTMATTEGAVLAVPANCRVRGLTIDHRDGAAAPVGLQIDSDASIRISDVTIRADGSSGVAAVGLKVTSTGGSAPLLEDSYVEASGAASTNHAVEATRIQAEDCHMVAQGGFHTRGVDVTVSVLLERCRVEASGSTTNTYGLDLDPIQPSGVYHTHVEIFGIGGTATALNLPGTASVDVRWSTLKVNNGSAQRAVFLSGSATGNEILFSDLEVAATQDPLISSASPTGLLKVGLSRVAGANHVASTGITCLRSHKADGTELTSDCE